MPTGAWLAQSVEHETLDLGGGGFEPHIGCRVTFQKIYKFKKSINKNKRGH